MKKINKSTLMAIGLLAIMPLAGAGLAQAQVNLLNPIHIPDTNPLLSTTGPNTVGKGHVQLGGMATWYGFSHDHEVFLATPMVHNSVNVHDNYRELGAGMALRYGFGSRFELMVGLTGADARSHIIFSNGSYDDTLTLLTPSLGLKMMLFEGGYGWLPQVSATMAYRHSVAKYPNRKWDSPEGGRGLILGFQFRNGLGARWTLDYGLSYRFGSDIQLGINSARVYAMQKDKPFQFNIMARWLAADKLMVSFGMENVGGVAEVMWQATPTLQLKAQGGIAAGIGPREGILETNAMVGFNWMMR